MLSFLQRVVLQLCVFFHILLLIPWLVLLRFAHAHLHGTRTCLPGSPGQDYTSEELRGPRHRCVQACVCVCVCVLHLSLNFSFCRKYFKFTFFQAPTYLG